MSLCDAPGLLTLEEALQILLQPLQAIIEVEQCNLLDADNRVLAEDVLSQVFVPPYDNSAMDGYALAAADAREGIGTPVSQRILAGDAGNEPLAPGTCARIMTGAPVPDGADTVVMQEQAEVTETGVMFARPPEPYRNIRRKGEEIAPGDCVLPRGRRLRAADIGLLASLGIEQVPLVRRPVVTLMTTGDELTQPGQPLAAGKIYESNSYVLSALLKRLGCDVRLSGIVSDDLQSLRQAYLEADAASDLVISTGGVSVGEADYVRDVLDEMGNVTLWKLAIKPGKPFAFGRLPNSWFAGLPGNPVSAVVTWHQLVAPALRQLSGESAEPPLILQATAAADFRKRPGRAEFQRVKLSRGAKGELFAEPLPMQGSSLLTTLSQADGYALLDQQSAGVAAGEALNVSQFDKLLS